LAKLSVYTENVKFDWDRAKAESNLKKHGISFMLAITVFDDPHALIAPDPRHSKAEAREWIIGESDRGVLVVSSPEDWPGQCTESLAHGELIGEKGNYMRNSRDFPFERARRISAKEIAVGRKAIEEKTGQGRRSRGRPVKSGEERFVPTSIRLHPKVLEWAKREAKRRGCGYQTVINKILLEKAV
jgi:uncharacterized protein (DUF4415 family)